jgi:hypothetical protein
MSHPAPVPADTPAGRPWRVLIHDPGRGDGDPKFVLAVVADPGDVLAASPFPAIDDTVVTWVAGRHGAPRVQLTRLPHAAVWRVDEAVT